MGSRDSDRKETNRSDIALGWPRDMPGFRLAMEAGGKDLRFDTPIAWLMGSKDSERRAFDPCEGVTGWTEATLEDFSISGALGMSKETGVTMPGLIGN